MCNIGINQKNRAMKKLICIFISFIVCYQASAQNGQYENVNGIKLYYEVYGEGQPLVMLHGFTMNHEMWEPWVDDFSNKYKLILVDLRGHGHSTNPSSFTHQKSAKDIYGLLDSLQIDTFQAMGFSSGAITLTHMATLDSTRIQSMVLIGSTSYFPESSKPLLQSFTYEDLGKGWMNRMQKSHPRGEAQIRALLTQFRKLPTIHEDVNFTPPFLSAIKIPTLIIHGDRDSFFPIDIPVTSYESMPNSYLWVLPNFGHNYIDKKSIWEEAFLKVTNQFFSGEWEK